jgi:glycosyltransferase involved in cell wall biosynthesis
MLGHLRYLYTRIRLKHKQLGFLGLCLFAIKRVKGQTPTRHNVIGFYQFVLEAPFGQQYDPQKHGTKTMNWVIPNFGIGSGGHLNIFRMIANLEKKGFICRIIIVEDSHYISAEKAREDIRTHFVQLNAEVSIGRHTMKPAAFTVATSWQTAYPVRDFRGSPQKCYFVQDYEPYFTAPGSDYALAEATYSFGFQGITAGKWLTDKLSAEYNMPCQWFGFSYDKELYTPAPRRADGKKRIFFYARPVTPRRGFELGLLVLNEVAKRMPNVECVLAGWDTSMYHIPFAHQSLGMVALDKLSAIYSQCDVALVLSFTNLSLLPLELMASGCPVVSNTGENAEWALNKDNCILATPTVEGLTEALLDILNNDTKRANLREHALAYVKETSWEKEADKVAEICEGLLEGNATPSLKKKAG